MKHFNDVIFQDNPTNQFCLCSLARKAEAAKSDSTEDVYVEGLKEMRRLRELLEKVHIVDRTYFTNKEIKEYWSDPKFKEHRQGKQ